jgi:hypothetical protein
MLSSRHWNTGWLPSPQEIDVIHRVKRERWKALAAVSVGFAAAFVLFGGLTFGYSPRSAGALALSGLFLGAIGAPEMEPKAFRRPRVWQSVCGVIAGATLAAAMGAPLLGWTAGVVFGGILGATARHWIYHVQIP